MYLYPETTKEMGENYYSMTAEEQIGQCVRNHITSDLRHNPEAKVIDLTYAQDGRVLLIQSGDSDWFRLYYFGLDSVSPMITDFQISAVQITGCPWLAPGAEIAGRSIEKISYVMGAVWVKLQ